MIEKMVVNGLSFDCLKAIVDDINKIIKALNSRKATFPRLIPIVIIKNCREFRRHSCKKHQQGPNKHKFFKNAKAALVKPKIKKTTEAKFKIIDL